MTRLVREVAVAAHTLSAFIPCAATSCGRWARTCAGCHRRRYSPTILRPRW